MTRMTRITVSWVVALLVTTLSACSSLEKAPMQTVPQVDLQRFMGDWYVIANIPTFIEKGAHNAVESYALNGDGTVATTLRFCKGAFEGPEKVYHPKGFVIPGTGNARWGMQFIWPFKGDFRIICGRGPITASPSSGARSAITSGSWPGSRRSPTKSTPRSSTSSAASDTTLRRFSASPNAGPTNPSRASGAAPT